MPGERAVRELVDAAPGRVHRVWVDPRNRELANWLGTQPVEVAHVDRAALDDRLAPHLHRGVLAEADPPPVVDVTVLVDRLAQAPGPQVLVALDEVQDPHNLGAVVRSAEFFGAGGLFWCRDRSSGLSPVVVRASAGASERLPLGIAKNLARALQYCKDAGFWVVGTVVDGGVPLDRLAGDPDRPERLVVVLGGEHRGLRRLTREACDFLATIARHGEVGSLNVSAAAAVTLDALCRASLFVNEGLAARGVRKPVYSQNAEQDRHPSQLW